MSDPTLAPLPPAPSTSPLPPPSEPISAPPAPLPQPESETAPPPASLKPLLNPLQTTDTPPASTTVEPPRSPNVANEATDDKGRNVDLSAPGSAAESVVGPADVPMVENEAVLVPETPQTSMMDGLAGVASAAGDRSPLPIDAPVPPSPQPPRDEVPPVAAPGLIPPAVSTPTVIASEDDAMLGAGAGGVNEPAPTPVVNGAASEGSQLPSAGPSSTAFDTSSPLPPAAIPNPIPPAPTSSEPAQPPMDSAAPVAPSDAMDIDADADAVGEDDDPSARAVDAALGPGPDGSSAPGTLKRPGDELAGMEAKRQKEQNGTESSASLSTPQLQPAFEQAPVSAPSASPAAPAASAPAPAPTPSAPASFPSDTPVTFVPAHYVPPPPRDSGPTTPLTQNQHKHLLAAVRSLKKSKDAINFLAPVDTVLFGIPHYNNIVKNPMDLGTVETKLIVSNPRGPPKDKSKMGNWDTSKGRYGNVSEVVQDVRQIWENTRMFNGPDHVVSQMATRLEASFEKAVATLPNEISTPQASPAPFATPAPPSAGPSTAAPRRASISRPPAPRRSSDGLDRPKREIHPPPSKELPYANDPVRKKRRNDPQIAYLGKQIRMMETKNAELTGAFLYPIEEIVKAIPDYKTVVKTPIDLNIIKGKINDGEYDDATQLNADFRMMCNNATKFNPPSHEVHIFAQRLLSVWEEKWRALPSKEVPVSRSYSEDPVADEGDADEDDFETDERVKMLREQIAQLESKIEEIKSERRKLAPPRPKKSKPAASRKQSVSQAKTSPGINGNGYGGSGAAPKKPRKSREVNYQEDGYESEEEVTTISLTQKQELAEKITHADGDTLQKAIQIIAESTGLDGSNEEIELDIESLPSRTVVQLYHLVCGGKLPKKGANRNTSARASIGGGSGMIPGRKPGRKPGKKHLNEQEEAARIERMEAQLKSFENRGGQMPMGGNGGYEDSESSEEEESEEE